MCEPLFRCEPSILCELLISTVESDGRLRLNHGNPAPPQPPAALSRSLHLRIPASLSLSLHLCLPHARSSPSRFLLFLAHSRRLPASTDSGRLPVSRCLSLSPCLSLDSGASPCVSLALTHVLELPRVRISLCHRLHGCLPEALPTTNRRKDALTATADASTGKWR